MNIDWNALVNKIVDLVAPIFVSLVKTVFSPDFFLIMLATICATHMLKLFIQYMVKDPHKAVIWFALTPLVSLFFSFLTWNGSDRFDWVIVGFAASPASNVLFWVGMGLINKVSPTLANKINDPFKIKTKQDNGDENASL